MAYNNKFTHTELTDPEGVIDWVKEVQTQLYEQAYEMANHFWEVNADKSTNKNNREDFGFLGVRVRKAKYGVSIEWYNNVFLHQEGTKKRKPISKYITKGKKPYYLAAKLKNHKYRRKWEEELIDELEPKFTEIRKKSDKLVQIAQQVNRLSKELELAKK